MTLIVSTMFLQVTYKLKRPKISSTEESSAKSAPNSPKSEQQSKSAKLPTSQSSHNPDTLLTATAATANFSQQDAAAAAATLTHQQQGQDGGSTSGSGATGLPSEHDHGGGKCECANERVVISANGNSAVLCPAHPPAVSSATTACTLCHAHRLLASSSSSPAVAQAAAAQERQDSDSEPAPVVPSNNRSRQKKFMKTFSQLPQGELVLQRYSCALVGDILLQGHLYITENYFAFYSNVFGYVTKLQIPIRSVIKVSKEKTAKIIPNAVGLATAEEKHVFGSLLSRDSTFKFLTLVWKRALKDQLSVADVIDKNGIEPTSAPATVLVPELVEEATGDVIEASSESDPNQEEEDVSTAGPPIAIPVVDPMEAQYLVKRMSNSGLQAANNHPSPRKRNIPESLLQQQQQGEFPDSLTPTGATAEASNTSVNGHHESEPGGGARGRSGNSLIRGHLTSIAVMLMLFFLFCSSIYLVYTVHHLQLKLESRYSLEKSKPLVDLSSIFDSDSSERMQKILDKNVGQIAQVRKNLEKLSSLLTTDSAEAEMESELETADIGAVFPEEEGAAAAEG